MSFLGSLRTWLLFNNKIIPQKYNLPNNSALPVFVSQKRFITSLQLIPYLKGKPVSSSPVQL